MFFDWLGRLLARRKSADAQTGRTRMIMYTRTGCHLCEQAWRLLQAKQRLHHFALEAVDIDIEPGLASRYGELVPVVSVNGKVRFRGRVNEVLLDRLLEVLEAETGK